MLHGSLDNQSSVISRAACQAEQRTKQSSVTTRTACKAEQRDKQSSVTSTAACQAEQRAKQSSMSSTAACRHRYHLSPLLILARHCPCLISLHPVAPAKQPWTYLTSDCCSQATNT